MIIEKINGIDCVLAQSNQNGLFYLPLVENSMPFDFGVNVQIQIGEESFDLYLDGNIEVGNNIDIPDYYMAYLVEAIPSKFWVSIGQIQGNFNSTLEEDIFVKAIKDFKLKS